MKKILIFLIYILSNESFCQKLIYGNLSSHIDSALSTITIDTFHIKQVSTDSITQNILISTIESILKYEYKYAIMKADSMGYHIIRLVDTTTFPGKSYFLLERKTEYNKYYGIYIFNSNPQSPRTIFQHSSKNEGNVIFGKSIYIFVKSQARAIFFPPNYPDPVKFNENLFEIINNVSKFEKNDVFFFQLSYFLKNEKNFDLNIGGLFSNNSTELFLAQLNKRISINNPEYKIQIDDNLTGFYAHPDIKNDEKIIYSDSSTYFQQNQYIDIVFKRINLSNNDKNLENIVEPIIQYISEYKDNVVLPIDSSSIKIKFGIRTDLTAFYEKWFGQTYNTEFNIYFNDIDPLKLSLYFYSKVGLTDNIYLEFRPGLLFINDNFSGLELMILLNWYFLNKKTYLTGGINFHNKIEQFNFNEGMPSPGTQYNEKTQKSIGIGIGYHLSEKISLDLSIFKTLKEEYANIFVPAYPGSSRIIEIFPEYLYFYMKLGINFTF